MDIEEYRKYLSISDASQINEKAFKSEKVAMELKKNGYVVVKNVLNKDVIENLKQKWVEILSQKSRLSSSLRYGEPNYTCNFFGKYKRHFQFYWNNPTCKLSSDISLLLHYYRNKITGFSPLYGLTFKPDRTGIYLAVTHYPSGTGEMAVHVDPNNFLPIHYMLPLTFLGSDYSDGGLHMHNKDKPHHVDALLDPGDLVLFNGSVPHSVKPIKGAGSVSSLGRIQMFAIPTQFQTKTKPLIKELVWQAYGRMKYLSYRGGKGLRQDHKNFR